MEILNFFFEDIENNSEVQNSDVTDKKTVEINAQTKDKKKLEEKPTTGRKRRISELVNSAEASTVLAQTSQDRLEFQKEYYNKKLIVS